MLKNGKSDRRCDMVDLSVRWGLLTTVYCASGRVVVAWCIWIYFLSYIHVCLTIGHGAL